MKFSPRKYQRVAIDRMWDQRKIALIMRPGTGKTVCTTHTIARSFQEFDTLRWLVVAPLRVCETTWVSEMAKWEHCRDIETIRLYGLPPKQRALELGRARHSRETVTVINYDNLIWLMKQCGRDWPFDGLILDESSKLKDASTKRFKGLRYIWPKLDRVVELTGSPAAQGLLGLWSQMYLLDQGNALGRSMQAFKTKWFTSDYMGYKWEPREGAQEDIEQAVRPLAVTIESDVKLPPSEQYLLPFELPEKCRAIYEQLEVELVAQLEDGDTVAAMNAGVLVSKLQQVSNGFLYKTLDVDASQTGAREWQELHDEKYQVLDDFIEEMSGTPFLLAYHFNADLFRLKERYGKETIEVFDGTPDQIKRFGQKKIPVLAIHPQSGGHGVDGLQYGTNAVVWLSPPWSLEQYEQLNGRVIGVRQKGTEFETVPGSIYHIVGRKTVDEYADSVLKQRDAQQINFLNSLRSTYLPETTQ